MKKPDPSDLLHKLAGEFFTGDNAWVLDKLKAGQVLGRVVAKLEGA